VNRSVCIRKSKCDLSNSERVRPLDHRKPEVLLFEPQTDGTLRLVGIEYFVLATGQAKAPRILGQSFQGPMTHNGTAPAHYDLHVWTYRRNPRGTFEQYNPKVSCVADDVG
jgi:hypothetical protein